MPGPQHRTAAAADSVTRDDVAVLDVAPPQDHSLLDGPAAPIADGREAGAGTGIEGPVPGRARGRGPTRAPGAGRVAAAVAATLLAGLAAAWLTRPQPSSPPVGSDPIRPVTAPSGVADAPGAPSQAASKPVPARPATVPAAAPVGRPAVPERLVIQRLGIDMKVVPEGVARDGAMALPETPAQAGWYRYGPRPGDPSGATVLAAHLDMPGYGIGPIAKVEELRSGDVVTVRSAGTTHRFRVTAVASVRKTSLDLSALFARDGPPRLHIVTCGGEFDSERRRYDENVVVTAEPMT